MTQALDNLCYGSPIQTPNLNGLVAGGLAYTNMHKTALYLNGLVAGGLAYTNMHKTALCSPIRSCMITGRNHHSNNIVCITKSSTGYPGYNGNIPFENGFFVRDTSAAWLLMIDDL